MKFRSQTRPDYVNNGIAFFIQSNEFSDKEIFTGLKPSTIYANILIGDWIDVDGNKSTIGLIVRRDKTIKLIILTGYLPKSWKSRELAVVKAIKKKHPKQRNYKGVK